MYINTTILFALNNHTRNAHVNAQIFRLPTRMDGSGTFRPGDISALYFCWDILTTGHFDPKAGTFRPRFITGTFRSRHISASL